MHEQHKEETVWWCHHHGASDRTLAPRHLLQHGPFSAVLSVVALYGTDAEGGMSGMNENCNMLGQQHGWGEAGNWKTEVLPGASESSKGA